MTDKRQSDALHLAGIADDGAWTFVIGVRKELAAELRRQYAEIETLRTGYEAARLEIESLQLQLTDQGRVLEKVMHELVQTRCSTKGGPTTAYAAKHYAKRDHQAQGAYYVNHVSAMTGEGLHAKSAIAAELAHRDMEIDSLRAALAAPAQPVAQQAMAYAALPEPALSDDLYCADMMRDFADATHALRVESLAAAYLEELDKLSQRNYELRLASHGQAPVSKIMGLTAAQESLGVEFEKVLHDNLFDLYEESPQTAPAHPVAHHGAAYAALPDAPLPVFSKGPWTFKETGQNFSGAELDEAAFVAYRDRASREQAPASTSGDFIRRTNEDYAAWCATKYTPEFNSKGPDLHGLWAWQEQQRRMDDLLRQAPINLNCKSEQKRLATLWGFVPAQATPAAVAAPVAELVTTAHGFETTLSLLPGHFDLPYGTHLLYAAPQPAAQALDDGCPHGSKHIVHDCMRCGAPVCCGKCCAEDAQALDAREKLHTDVARAIWEVMREYEDSCDLELEDVPSNHQVWFCADAAIAAKQGGAA